MGADLQEKYSRALDRRREILQQMGKQFAQNQNCSKCQGYCCTFEFNSMRMTPLEALDLYQYLKREKRINQDLIETLKATIKNYRLDYEIITGRGTLLRRNYTCPFFQAGAKGCSVAPEAKPYGCLAFNPEQENVSKPGFCSSQTELLQKMPDCHTSNEEIRQRLGLNWQQESIPVALLSLIESLG